MRIAFYAPLKQPTAPRPSGDRRMARLLMAALKTAGHEVTLASIFRSRDGSGDAARQIRLRNLGQRLAARLIRRYRSQPAAARPALWFTYHCYYKAPDWIGPEVSRALDIPYIIAEASHAPKRSGGNWATGHDGAAHAIAAADIIIGLNAADTPCVTPLLRDTARLIEMKPFLDTVPYGAMESQNNRARSNLLAETGFHPDIPVLMTVAMMRDGDKLASYRVLADALAQIDAPRWQLAIIGDGAKRAEIEEMFSRLTNGTVRFLGLREAAALPDLLSAADLFLWPAINEAYGMAILEAQAAGLPVIAGRSGGVAGIVGHGDTGLLSTEGDTREFADNISRLLASPDERRTLSKAAAMRVARDHSLKGAAIQMNDILSLARKRAAA
jgi:glycosyltransferase involved in cell wall biosynthesis